MSDHVSMEQNSIGYTSQNVGEEVSEIQTLTQEVVNEQIKRFTVRLTRELEELTQLVQGMTT